jgi:hypothetical protein
MKTTLVSLLTAAFLVFVSTSDGHSFDVTDFIAVAFTVCLAAWTMAQYSRRPRPLVCARPIRLPVSPGRRQSTASATRLAA